MPSGKKILLGVCGSIAAYKSVYLLRLLTGKGHDVKVVMTPAATTFVTPLTFGTLSGHPVGVEFAEVSTGTWNSHIELSRWADLLLIAPATAHTMAKMIHGECDNLLMAVWLSARSPVMIAPAMDADMWNHPATKANVSALKKLEVEMIPVGKGEHASGLEGPGRMAEPEEILQAVERLFSAKKKLQGKTVLVTAGPTYEPIDPVRFIGNHSSGKMGVALADAFREEGAEVILVQGPGILSTHNSIQSIRVTTADEMHSQCRKFFPLADIFVSAAAVADYTPISVSPQKIKKDNKPPVIELKKTKDILADLSSRKKKNQFIVGFALETENELGNARKKLRDKDLDMIVLNSLRDEGAGFSHETNKITILLRSGKMRKFGLKPKEEAARDIVREVINQYL